MKKLYIFMLSIIMILSGEEALSAQVQVRRSLCCSRLRDEWQRENVEKAVVATGVVILLAGSGVFAWGLAEILTDKIEVPYIRSLNGSCGSCADISNISICPMASNITLNQEILRIEKVCSNKNFILNSINCDQACPPCKSLDEVMTGVQKMCGGNSTEQVLMTPKQKMSILRKKMADKRKSQR